LSEGGRAAEILAEWVTVLKMRASDLVYAATINEEAPSISGCFTAR